MRRKKSYFSSLGRNAKPLIHMEGVDCDSLARVSRSTGYQNTGVRDAQTLQSATRQSACSNAPFQFVRSTRR